MKSLSKPLTKKLIINKEGLGLKRKFLLVFFYSFCSVVLFSHKPSIYTVCIYMYLLTYNMCIYSYHFSGVLITLHVYVDTV